MNPVAKRLRDRDTPYGWAALAETAAVEIDRLEAENRRLEAELMATDHQLVIADDCIGRLRERLAP